jgi:hypothetical protein
VHFAQKKEEFAISKFVQFLRNLGQIFVQNFHKKHLTKTSSCDIMDFRGAHGAGWSCAPRPQAIIISHFLIFVKHFFKNFFYFFVFLIIPQAAAYVKCFFKFFWV